MVSWQAGEDGILNGYDPVTKRLQTDVFLFASAGTVDLNGQTRLQYPVPAYSNRLSGRIPLTFTAADFTDNNATSSARGLTGGLIYARASHFAEGVIPTPEQILALGESKLGWWTGSKYHWGYTTTLNYDYNVLGWEAADLDPNTKYWILAGPFVRVPSATFGLKRMAGVNYNVHGRVISIWTNRTPEKPVITSPPSGALVNPGDTFDFAYTVSGNDVTTPNDADRYNMDLAGVQIQYAPMPTQENPNPEWQGLPYKDSGGVQGIATYIRGGGGTSVHSASFRPILTNLGLGIVAATDITESPNAKGVLPGGDWQLRVRVVDWGHPYPGLIDPLGLDLQPNQYIDINKYPAANTSAWSDPVRVTVPVQVPPPLPLSPKDNIAIPEGTDARLLWKYLNTASPDSTPPGPYDQAHRVVQIKKISDPLWSTIFAGESAFPYVDVPPVLDNAMNPPSPHEYMADGGFGAGGLDGWTASDPFEVCDGSQTLINVSGAGAHTGVNRLDVQYAGTGWPGFEKVVDLLPGHDQFRFTGWIHPVDSATTVTAGIVWLDAAGTPLPDEVQNEGWSTTKPVGEAWPGDGWVNPDTGVLKRPIGAAKIRLTVQIYDLVGFDMTGFGGSRLDDVSLVGTQTYPLSDFTLEATTQYEWRVQVTDTGNETSDFSTPARFWVVPEGATGELRPVPENTIEGATLGCGTHRVFVYRRGGKERVGELTTLSYVDWGRMRDDISTAKVVVSGWDVDCGEMMKNLQTWAYELVIFRDNGYTTDRVWEGPITLITYEHDKVTLSAKDVMGYAYRRIIKQRMSDTGVGDTVVNRAVRVLRNVFAPDDPNVLAYLQAIPQADDAIQYRSTPAYSRTAFEEVDDMAANAGLDYCAVGRSILLWGTKHRIGTLPELRDADLGAPPIVSEYGMSMANVYSVSDGAGVHGEATRLGVSGNDPIYGLVEMLSSTWATDSEEDTGTYTQEGLATVVESFEDFAERSIADRYPPPVVVRIPDNTTLNPSTVLSIQQLVPGVAIPLRSTRTLREVVGIQKLDSVKVVETEGRETISITLSSFSREDNSTGEGEVEV